MTARKRHVRPPEALTLAAEFGVDPADEVGLNRVECGLHSGFPRCCILFFVKFWGPLMDAADRAAPREVAAFARGQINTYFALMSRMHIHPGYVPCPRCLAEGNFVEVLPCDCNKRRCPR